MNRPIRYVTPFLLGATLLACSPAGSGTTPATGETPSVGISRTVVIGSAGEPATAAAKGLQTAGLTGTPRDPFNAGLAYQDDREVRHAELAEALPQLGTSTWQVFPDGRMETAYRLKPGLAWHDGAPLSAEDFSFALRVYKVPEYGSSSPRPQNLIDRIAVTDDRTFTVHWSQPFPEAGSMTASQLQALPRHILSDPVDRLPPDAFAAHPFWTTDYVGLGPYRIDNWQHGVSIEAVAFDRYVRGAPQIDRIRFVFITDANTSLANLLAGAVHIAVNKSVRFNEGLVLMRQWSEGTVLVRTDGSRAAEFQLHPERVSPGLAGTLDVRVRRAMAHATDKQAINDTVFEGQGRVADTRVEPHLSYFPQVDQTISKYPYDLRRAEQLMNEVGYRKGSDGTYVSSSGVRFEGEDWIGFTAESELMQQITTNAWRVAGFDIRPKSLSAVEQRDSKLRAERPGFYTGDGGTLLTLGTENIPRAENRFTGSNRGSYSNPEFDRLLDIWNSSLDHNERIQAMVRMARISSDDLPSIPINYILQITPHVNTLKGVKAGTNDIHLWTWTA